MAINPEREIPANERAERGAELKAARVEAKRATKAEREAAEAELAARGERAERKILAEREKSRERESILSKEKARPERKKPIEPKVVRRVRPKPKTKAERESVFKSEIKMVQAQLSPIARTFSKVIHNTGVEKISDVAEKSIMRPSALIGGAVCGLLFGGLIYFIARVNNYIFSSLEIIVVALIGAFVGVVVELLIRRVRG